MPKKSSPAKRLVEIVWDNCQEGKDDVSWRRLNRSMREAVMLAITSGLVFDREDFRFFEKKYRIWHWGGINNGRYSLGEGFYSRAVDHRNRSACLSFETWKERRPFIYEGQRVCIGSKFTWEGEFVECTSFARDGSYLIACSHHEKRDDEPLKVKYRFKITWNDLKGKRKSVKDQ